MIFNSETDLSGLLWTISLVLTSLFTGLVFYLIYLLVIRPKVKMAFYAKQGISCAYFPLSGRVKLRRHCLKEYGDSLRWIKVKSKTNPERVSCSNLVGDAYISLHDPAIIKEFYRNSDNYIKDPRFLEIYTLMFGQGLVTSEGAKWKFQRKIFAKTFHFEFLRSMIPGMQTLTRQILSNIQKKSLTDVNIMDEFQRITGEVIGLIFFGERINQYESDGRPLTLALQDILHDLAVIGFSPSRYLLGLKMIKRGILPAHKRLMQRINSFKKVCYDIMKEKKNGYLDQNQELRTKDMVDILLETEDEEGRLSEDEIIDQFITFFLAGMDTAGHLVTMVVYNLHKYQDHKIQVTEEVDKYYQPMNEPGMDEINKLEFTLSFIKETLRVMCPAVGIFLRKAVRDHNLDNICIRKGDIVGINFFYNHFNEEYFPEPENFDPSRWTTNKDKFNDSYAFTPFSIGPRKCIGQQLGLLETKIILAEFIKMYDFKVKDGYKLRMELNFLYEPVDSILLNLTPRISK